MNWKRAPEIEPLIGLGLDFVGTEVGLVSPYVRSFSSAIVMTNRYSSNFRSLRVWNDAVELAVKIYAATRSLPSEERFGLAQQLRKSGVSVASNIAEGNARLSLPDYIRHLSIARGSLAELETQVEIASRAGVLSEIDSNDLLGNISIVARQLQALINALRKKRSE